MKNIIETKKLCKEYDSIYRVKHLSLQVREGEVYGFLGPNGAGKSTTMKMLLGLAQPTSGDITVFGKPFTAENRLDILKHTGSLIESPSYYGHLTARENMHILQKLSNISEKDALEALRIVRLDNQLDKKVSQFSFGMKQRLGIAMAIAGFPKLLILDEPTNGLDPAGIEEIRELIKSLPAKYGITVMISSHLLSEIDQMATTCGIINHGELIFQGSLKSLHAYSSASIAFKTSNPVATEALLHHMKPQIKNEAVLVHGIDDKMTARINRLVIEKGIDVYRIEEHTLSLEDIFLKLTGKGGAL